MVVDYRGQNGNSIEFLSRNFIPPRNYKIENSRAFCRVKADMDIIKCYHFEKLYS